MLSWTKLNQQPCPNSTGYFSSSLASSALSYHSSPLGFSCGWNCRKIIFQFNNEKKIKTINFSFTGVTSSHRHNCNQSIFENNSQSIHFFNYSAIMCNLIISTQNYLTVDSIFITFNWLNSLKSLLSYLSQTYIVTIYKWETRIIIFDKLEFIYSR